MLGFLSFFWAKSYTKKNAAVHTMVEKQVLGAVAAAAAEVGYRYDMNVLWCLVNAGFGI